MPNWIRQCQLNVGGYSFTGGTYNQTLKCEFQISQAIGGQPGWADITITNVGRTEGKSIVQSLARDTTSVTFLAGYENGLYGQIFNGDLVWAAFGKKSPTDTYLQIQAICKQGAHNIAVVNKRLPANCTGMDVLNACVQAMSPYGVSVGQVPTQALQKIIYPRGVSLFGMARDYVGTLGHSVYSQWNIDNNASLNMVPLNGNLGGPWQINPATGMIGMPVFTTTGLVVRALINPTINAGTTIQLDPNTISIGAVDSGTFDSQATAANTALALQGYDKGLFKVLDIKFNGDTRGQPWYMDMTCMVDNGSQPVGSLADTPPDVPVNASTVSQGRQ